MEQEDGATARGVLSARTCVGTLASLAIPLFGGETPQSWLGSWSTRASKPISPVSTPRDSTPTSPGPDTIQTSSPPYLRIKWAVGQHLRNRETVDGQRTLGCPKVNLQVRATNAGVVAFYQSLGY